MNLGIRPATCADIDALLELERRCYRFPWSRRQFCDEFDNAAASLDVALVDLQIAGYLCSWLICGELQIQNLAISPAFRRRGIGQALLEYVISRCLREGLTSAWLEVRDDNQAAINLYLACGFVLQGRRKKYYQDGTDALLLGKSFQ